MIFFFKTLKQASFAIILLFFGACAYGKINKFPVTFGTIGFSVTKENTKINIKDSCFLLFTKKGTEFINCQLIQQNLLNKATFDSSNISLLISFNKDQKNNQAQQLEFVF